MFYVRFLVVIVLLCLIFVPGFQTRRMSLEEDLTVLIDYGKYQERTRRTQRQINPEWARTTNTSATPKSPTPPFYPYQVSSVQNQGQIRDQQHRDKVRDHRDCDDKESKECEIKVCDDPENEVYQECGSKCVLGCRYATTSAGITISKHDCEKNDCVEGCFCKTGLVRHQTKCIPASECPVRKCNHRYEVYMCGPAAPITCDNALRGEEISDLTRHVECIWGCYCAQGYLRNNYNGKCVPENECRNTKSVNISPQIPGLFKHIYGCPSGGCPCNGAGCPCPSGGCNSNEDSSEENNGNQGSWNLPPMWGYPAIPAFTGSLTHFHHWDNSSVGVVGSGNSSCVGKAACAGNVNQPSINAPLPNLPETMQTQQPGPPLTQISFENGTTLTIPVIPGTQIDVSLQGLSSGEDGKSSEESSEEENVGEELGGTAQTQENPATAAPAQAINSPYQFGNPFLGFPSFPYNAYPNSFPPFGGIPQPQFPPQVYFSQLALKKPDRKNEKAPSTVHLPIERAPVPMKPSGNEAAGGEMSENENHHSNSELANNQNQQNYQANYANYFNSFNPNQYYPNNGNGLNGNNQHYQQYQQQLAANQQQLAASQQQLAANQQFNPYNFQQSINPYGNPQFNGYFNQGFNNANHKRQNVKHKPYNKNKMRPNTYPEMMNQQGSEDSDSSNGEEKDSEEYDMNK